ncbi:hypothetical protein Tco_1034463 [Tanacetum coccineum]
MITSKLPGSMGIKSILNRGFRKLSIQSQMIVPTSRFFSSANSTEYLVSTVDGTMPHKELNSAEVRLLSTRFHVLAIISSFASTSGPSKVLSIRESHNLHDSNSQKGVGFGLLAKGVVSLYAKVPRVSSLPLWSLSRYQNGCPTISTHNANSLVVIALHSARSSEAQLTFVVVG